MQVGSVRAALMAGATLFTWEANDTIAAYLIGVPVAAPTTAGRPGPPPAPPRGLTQLIAEARSSLECFTTVSGV